MCSGGEERTATGDPLLQKSRQGMVGSREGMVGSDGSSGGCERNSNTVLVLKVETAGFLIVEL